ncbi:hypothetical protein HI914_05297 [Erysiphe necator]|nr:hypothetical protein HI914_05297 [Erysiphe necator]
MRNHLVLSICCTTAAMAIDPTAQPIIMEAAATAEYYFPTATACANSPYYQNSTVNFPKLPSPTGQVPYMPNPDNNDDDDDDDDEDDDDDDDDDVDVDKKMPYKPDVQEKKPQMPSEHSDRQHFMPDDQLLQTVTMTTTTCIPTVITSVITLKKPGPTSRPVYTSKPDYVYVPKPSASSYNPKPDPNKPQFTGAASMAECSGLLVFLVSAIVLLSSA